MKKNYIFLKHRDTVITKVLKKFKKVSLIFTEVLSDYDCVPLEIQEKTLKLLNEAIKELEDKDNG
ncbi:MAG: hypothetical protein E2O29_01680 [Deltaproteobacteria bacterium]|nr:MAG: hypothetical protein E2O29_01680 [Deltaproteobacteria bacterium]